MKAHLPPPTRRNKSPRRLHDARQTVVRDIISSATMYLHFYCCPHDESQRICQSRFRRYALAKINVTHRRENPTRGRRRRGGGGFATFAGRQRGIVIRSRCTRDLRTGWLPRNCSRGAFTVAHSLSHVNAPRRCAVYTESTLLYFRCSGARPRVTRRRRE